MFPHIVERFLASSVDHQARLRRRLFGEPAVDSELGIDSGRRLFEVEAEGWLEPEL